MTLAIMQPYIFPYIGYFQLINASDKFVVYSDVSFIKQGWINRNKILLNNAGFMFTVPLKDASSYISIAETELNLPVYSTWRSKFIKTLAMAYAKAPFYKRISDLVMSVLNEEHRTISDLATSSLTNTCSYIGVKSNISFDVTEYHNNNLKGQARIIDICKQEGAGTYINPIGGQELYSKDEFAAQNIELKFIKTGAITYTQFNNDFNSWLSIIDVMMFNSPENIMDFLGRYDLI
jgi:hypothetical protein